MSTVTARWHRYSGSLEVIFPSLGHDVIFPVGRLDKTEEGDYIFTYFHLPTVLNLGKDHDTARVMALEDVVQRYVDMT